MESKKRVLVVGVGQSNFLKQLYSAIHKVAPNSFKFDIYGLKELSGKDEYGIEVFNNIFPVRKKLSIKDVTNALNLKLIKLFAQFIRYGASLKTTLGFIKRYSITKSDSKEYNFSDYDIIHIHFPTFDKLDAYWHIPENVKCIVTFWGSDLMRNKGIFNYYIQDHVLSRADIITTHGNELKQQILTKFGRNLDNKIHLTRFPAYDFLYSLMEDKLNQPKATFRLFIEKYKIAIDKKIVVIGHNGSQENNHIKIINALKNLPFEVKKDICFVLPFSYKSSSDGAYEILCQNALESAELHGELLRAFMPWDELAVFKCITDIMIHMPVSDALSGAMTESLFAGAKVIVGDWLPYSPFINEGLTYESTNFEELKQVFLEVFNTLPEREEVVLKNRKIIKERFLSDYCAKTWLPVLK